ncbi:hypothetical protein IE81DRAFT_321322 [Ceraceosorus guamensis]|uniref:Uncharacterized protein n=1 Tax=Ceraceosorus guamensis TaxID=1522189 RepID=A0A316W5R0_9BASI|nr:hypothetical protein IE81DRAFT_321322 [Ceraceosorus guamensis]PWN44428.1 hypothetical protein IE81DRAFT_321322 [Ceraceosorus guamensis]
MSFKQHPGLTKESNPRDWAYNLGGLPQDDSIIFTKKSFIDFCKAYNIDVSPSFGEIKSLPRFAQIGKLTLSAGSSAEVESATQGLQTASLEEPRRAPAPPTSSAGGQLGEQKNVVRDPSGDAFRPTRRVRELIGGGSSGVTALFSEADDEEQAAAAAESARRRGLAPTSSAPPPLTTAAPASTNQGESAQDILAREQAEKAQSAQAGFRPTRRVREQVGGGSDAMQGIFGGN